MRISELGPEELARRLALIGAKEMKLEIEGITKKQHEYIRRIGIGFVLGNFEALAERVRREFPNETLSDEAVKFILEYCLR